MKSRNNISDKKSHKFHIKLTYGALHKPTIQSHLGMKWICLKVPQLTLDFSQKRLNISA